MSKLQVEVDQQVLQDGSPVVVAKIQGIVDANTFKNFELEIDSFFDKGLLLVILDLSGVTYINSTGMGLLVKVADKFKQVGGDIKLIAVPDKVKTIFNMLGLVNYFEMYANLQMAKFSYNDKTAQVIIEEETSAIEVPQMETAASICLIPQDIQEEGLAIEIDIDEKEEKELLAQAPIPKPTPMPKPNTQITSQSESQVVTGSDIESPPKRKTKKESRQKSITEAKPELKREIKCKATIRYYKRMAPFQCFPISVIFSQKQVSQAVQKKIAEATGKDHQEEPPRIIKVAPSIPGCLVTPSHRWLDISKRRAETRFDVTPLAIGDFPHARMEIFNNKQLLESFSIPVRCIKSTTAKVMLIIGFLWPLVSSEVDTLIGMKIPEWLGALNNITIPGNILDFGILLACSLTASILFWINKPKKGEMTKNTVISD